MKDMKSLKKAGRTVVIHEHQLQYKPLPQHFYMKAHTYT